MADDQEIPSGNLGQVVSGKLIESLQSMNVLDTLKKIVATEGGDAESEEVKKKLQGVIDKYTSMTTDEQATFQNQVREALASKLSAKLQDRFSNLQEDIGTAIVYRMGLLAAVAVVVVFIVVFFGYKLYKSIKDKELKKEEKRKAKLQKKKKWLSRWARGRYVLMVWLELSVVKLSVLIKCYVESAKKYHDELIIIV